MGKNNQGDIITFQQGIPGFPDCTEYCLTAEEDTPFILYLQSTQGEHPSFLVVDPFSVVDGYNPQLSAEDTAYFGGKPSSELKVLAIAVLSEDIKDTIVNLKSPIFLDPETGRAKQVILEQDYPIRYALFGQSA